MSRTSLLLLNKVLFSIPHLWAFINPAKRGKKKKGCSVLSQGKKLVQYKNCDMKVDLSIRQISALLYRENTLFCLLE